MSSENPNDPGNASKYDPKFCALLIEHMKQGFSFEAFTEIAGVRRSTLYNWVEAHPDFAEAKEIAFDKCRYFYEQQGIKGLWNSTGEGSHLNLNTTAWIFNMKNRFPKEWREKQPGEDDKTVTLKGEIKVEKIDLNERIKQLKGEE